MNDLSRAPPRSLPNNPSRRTVGQVPSARPAGLPPAQPLPAAAAAVDSKKDVSHVPCKFFRSGGCTAGSSCIFAHVQPEAGQQKQPCQYFQKGSCKFGRKCALAHILPGQPMSMDRKNKKAAEAQAQALTEKVASSLFASSPATLPPLPRANSNGASSTLNAIPAKPKSPSKPNGLPPNPTTGAPSSSQEKETNGAPLTQSSSDPAVVAATSPPSSSTSKAVPTTTRGFSFASLFPGSSASKVASTTASSSLPPRPSAAPAIPSPISTTKTANPPVDTTTNPSSASAIPPSILPPQASTNPTTQPPASTPVASQPSPLPSSSAHTFPAPPPSHPPPPPAVSFAFGSAVRPPNGTAFPPVQRKDIVFGTTNGENTTTSPPSSFFSPTNQHLSSLPSPKPYSALPTPIGPPYTRRTSHGPISPPASASSHSPQSFPPSPQHFHPTPTPLSPTRRLVPPLSSSSSYNAGPGIIGNGGAGGSPFSTSPFFAGPLGSRGLFLSSSYDNHVLDRTGSFTAGLPGGQPASMVDLDRGFEKWGGRGGRDLAGEESGDEYSERVGSRRVLEEDGQGGSDDGEDFLPSSLNELLTDQEMERRMTRRGSNTGGSSMIAALPSQQQQQAQYSSSNQFGSGNHSLFAAPHLQPPPPPPPITDDPRARMMEFNSLDRGHNSVPYSSTTMRPNLGMAPAMRSPWDDDEEVLGGGGTGRTVGRGRNTLRRPPVPFETNVASNGEGGAAYPSEGDGSFKIGPSHASVAFLPNFGERRYPAPPLPTDSFGHQQPSSNFFPPTTITTKNSSSLLSSSLLQRPTTPTNHNPHLSNGFPSAFSNLNNPSSAAQQRWNLPLLSSSSSTANSNSISSFPNRHQQPQQSSPQTQIGGFGQQQQHHQQYLHHAAASSTATLMAPLSPEELAASHEPGMSLPPGLGIGLGRTRIPFGVGIGGGDQHQNHFASNSNQPQQQQGYPSSGPWSSSTTTNTNTSGPAGGSGGRWIPSVGAGGGVGLQAEEDEMDDNVLFD